MRTAPCFSPWFRRALLLVVFCALLAVPQHVAQAGTASDNPQQLPSVQSASMVDFLAALSAAPVSSTGTGALQAPAPTFLTGCTSNAQCPTGQLCCLACGFDGCETRACFQPVRGRCPMFQ
jgi:hypothetical protein